MEFGSHYPTLRKSFVVAMKHLGYNVSEKGEGVILNSESEIYRYFMEVGSANPKHILKFLAHLYSKTVPITRDIYARAMDYPSSQLPYYHKV